MLISYYIMVIFKMAAKMAAVPLNWHISLTIYSKLVVKVSITEYFGDTSVSDQSSFSDDVI